MRGRRSFRGARGNKRVRMGRRWCRRGQSNMSTPSKAQCRAVRREGQSEMCREMALLCATCTCMYDGLITTKECRTYTHGIMFDKSTNAVVHAHVPSPFPRRSCECYCTFRRIEGRRRNIPPEHRCVPLIRKAPQGGARRGGGGRRGEGSVDATRGSHIRRVVGCGCVTQRERAYCMTVWSRGGRRSGRLYHKNTHLIP